MLLKFRVERDQVGSVVDVVLEVNILSLKLPVSKTNQSILNDIELSSIEGAVITVSSALLFAEESFSAASDTILLEDGCAGSSSFNVSKHDSPVGVGSGSNILLNSAGALLKVITKGVIVGNISESDVTEEIGGSWLEIPLSEDLIHTIEVSLTDIELSESLNIAAVNSEVSWDILF